MRLRKWLRLTPQPTEMMEPGHYRPAGLREELTPGQEALVASVLAVEQARRAGYLTVDARWAKLGAEMPPEPVWPSQRHGYDPDDLMTWLKGQADDDGPEAA
jgi:hypothetical protein